MRPETGFQEFWADSGQTSETKGIRTVNRENRIKGLIALSYYWDRDRGTRWVCDINVGRPSLNASNGRWGVVGSPLLVPVHRA